MIPFIKAGRCFLKKARRSRCPGSDTLLPLTANKGRDRFVRTFGSLEIGEFFSQDD